MICRCGHILDDHNAQGSRKGGLWTACSMMAIGDKIAYCYCQKFKADNLRYLEELSNGK